jgi:hypothetical protein
MLQKASRIAYVLLLLFFCYLMVRLTWPYLSFRTNVSFLRTKQGIIHIRPWRWAFYAHVITSTFVLFLGIFQFLPGVMRKYPGWHRLAGKIYIILVLGVSGPGGLIMGFYANGGWPARISFILLSLLWIGCTGFAFMLVRKKEFKRHSDFMLRSYALTLSAITLRLYAFFLPSVIMLKPFTAYILIAWLSWIPNLLIAEVLIRNRRRMEERSVSSSGPIQEEALPEL